MSNGSLHNPVLLLLDIIAWKFSNHVITPIFIQSTILHSKKVSKLNCELSLGIITFYLE